MAKIEKKKEGVNENRRKARHDILDDMLQLKLSSVNNINRAIKETIGQRVGIAQDIMNISLAVLGGAITLKIFANDTIKTHILFYFAASFLLLCVIFSLVIRIYIAKIWNETLF